MLDDFLPAGTAVTFSVKVQIPSFVASSQVKFYYMERHSQNIIEEGTGGTLSVSPESWSTQKFILGWGLDYTN